MAINFREKKIRDFKIETKKIFFYLHQHITSKVLNSQTIFFFWSLDHYLFRQKNSRFLDPVAVAATKQS